MTELEKVKELTKALQEGKTLVCKEDKRCCCKMINGVFVQFKNNKPLFIGATVYLDDWQIQEPEPEFEITPNQLALYECRDGSKAVCYGVDMGGYIVCYEDGTYLDDCRKNGLAYDNKISSYDLVRKIRDL